MPPRFVALFQTSLLFALIFASLSRADNFTLPAPPRACALPSQLSQLKREIARIPIFARLRERTLSTPEALRGRERLSLWAKTYAAHPKVFLMFDGKKFYVSRQNGSSNFDFDFSQIAPVEATISATQGGAR